MVAFLDFLVIAGLVPAISLRRAQRFA